MAIDARAPVLVGVGQTLRRLESPVGASEPVTMMVDALRLAADDSGVGNRVLEAADSIRIVEALSWRYVDPAALVAAAVGASPRELAKTSTGGNSPQMVVNDAAGAIQRGDLDVVLVAGAEAMYTRMLARKTRDWLEWTTQDPDETPAPRVIGEERPGTNDVEMGRSVAIPTQVYPVFETAVRAARGETVDEHQRNVSELWSRFSAVAAANPHAWSPVARTPEEIRTVTPDNRMIGFPYPKYMNSNLQTDQAAALVLCSVEAARRLGVPEDRWVYLHAAADGHDHWWVSERENLHSSPGVRLCGQRALALAEIGADDLAHVDLYSCFPSAVQVAAAELGLGLDRQLTVTGGLCFAGGPGNNYVTHSIASMTDTLRRDPGTFGLVTAVGWYLTKHAVGVYSTTPPDKGFCHAAPQDEIDALARRAYTGEYDGDVSVESYTVMHERDGSPALAIVACLLPDGRRAWGNSREPALLKAATTDDLVGAAAHLSADGTINLT